MAMKPRPFLLRRRVDRTGVSGIGDVAEGVLWSDGTVALRWRSPLPSTTHYDQGIRAVEAVHGHGGLTSVVWLDPAETHGGTASQRAEPDPTKDQPDQPRDGHDDLRGFGDGDGR